MVVGETEFLLTAEHYELQAQHSLEQGQEESDLEHSRGKEGGGEDVLQQYKAGLHDSMGMRHSGDGMGPRQDSRHSEMRMGSGQVATQQPLHDPELDVSTHTHKHTAHWVDTVCMPQCGGFPVCDEMQQPLLVNKT